MPETRAGRTQKPWKNDLATIPQQMLVLKSRLPILKAHSLVNVQHAAIDSFATNDEQRPACQPCHQQSPEATCCQRPGQGTQLQRE